MPFLILMHDVNILTQCEAIDAATATWGLSQTSACAPALALALPAAYVARPLTCLLEQCILHEHQHTEPGAGA